MSRFSFFILAFLALLQVQRATAECCKVRAGFGPILGSCCGNGRCNIFCCDCDGGCNFGLCNAGMENKNAFREASKAANVSELHSPQACSAEHNEHMDSRDAHFAQIAGANERCITLAKFDKYVRAAAKHEASIKKNGPATKIMKGGKAGIAKEFDILDSNNDKCIDRLEYGF